MDQWQEIFRPEWLVMRDIERTHFKSNLISLYFVRPLSSREATLGALLGRVLSFASEDYPSLRAISDQEDDLYGAVLYFDSDKYRDQLVLEYKLIYPKYHLLPVGHDLTDDVMGFYLSLLTKPLLVNGLFDPEIFHTEKMNLLEELDSLQKDPAALAYRKANELHFRDSDLGIYKYGDAQTLKSITNQELLDYYRQLMSEGPVYLYRHGDFSDRMVNRGIRPASRDALPWIEEKLTRVEERPINQSILVQAYQTDIDHTSPDSQAAMLFAQILGGYSNSVLFRVIREELGYCYYIYSKYDKYRNVMFISTGYQAENHEDLINTINQLVGQIQAGDISDDDFEVARLESIQGLKSLADRQSTRLDYEFIQDLFGKTDTIDDRVRQLEALTKEDIARAAKRFELTTSYLVKGTK